MCTSPDVCKTPVGSATPPIPYIVYGKAGDDTNYTSTVKSNGLIVKKSDSKFTRTYGDEPGIASALSSVNATHYLDIIAGGDPSSLGIGGAAENQRIGPMWTQKGRAESLKAEASRMRKEGNSGQKMNVELKICGE